ncbi:MAG: hypothetical protein MIO92_08445 [Methanosarcinaceae archaeon]|nr:hypothetical protein [Methanosarcinaceae archaeon]
MNHNKCILFFILFLSSNILSAHKIVYLSKTIINQKEYFIEFSSDIALGNNFYAISDSKAGNIKLIDIFGKITGTIGRKGPGPGEFVSPFRIAYINNTLYIYDFSDFKLSIYSKNIHNIFEFVSSKTVIAAYNFNIIDKDNILVAGYKNAKNGSYELYSINPANEKVEYWLPAYKKYGLSSESELNIQSPDLSKIGPFSFVYITDDEIYYIWEGKLSVVRIDRKSKEISNIDLISKSYSAPILTKRWREYYAKQGMGHIVDEEMQKYSFITGLIGNDNWIGIVIKNYNKEKEAWWPTLLIYNINTNQIEEFPFRDVLYFPTGQLPYDYSQSTNEIVFLSSVLNDDNIDYCIHKYKIEK